jgi:cyclopropane-fatty-acyl-phospholipid synthase
MPGGEAMRRDQNRHLIEELLALADVQIGGGRSWDITVHDDDFYPRVAAGGSLAMGETYVEGVWDCPALDAFFHRALRARLDERVPSGIGPIQSLRSRLQNPQSRANAFEVGERHYDMGNDLYRAMLDTRMIYSCALWDRATSLDEAQEDKLELACRKLGLERGMTLLDVGCGWGGAACYAAERFGVRVVGVTVSRRQADLAREVCAGLPVEIRLRTGARWKQFDR